MDHKAKLAEFELRTMLVDHVVLIHTTDGRAFKGRLVCVDSARNAMLQSATELRPPAPLTTRYVGPVMVPGGHIARVEIKQPEPSWGHGAAAHRVVPPRDPSWSYVP